MPKYKPGDKIGGEYSVLKVFGGEGQSGMGVVYLIQNREIPRPVVLKTFQDELSAQAKQQFIKEARAWISAGAHANIVQAHWVREIDGQVFVAAEYVAPDEEGRNTLTHFVNGGQLPLELVLVWATQFCHGMNYALSKRVVAHRDIKPDNLMIDRDGILKVTDFGLAKSSDVDRSATTENEVLAANGEFVTQAGITMGTNAYKAPEQFLDASSVDHRADIYSFGIVLYQMVTGNAYPYRITRRLPSAFYQAHFEQAPIPVDSPLMSTIIRCLEKDRRQRYANYEALLYDLENVARTRRIKVPKATSLRQEDLELYAEAQSYVALGDSVRALRAIEEYVAKCPENECGWTEKGKIHLEREEHAEALVATRRSLEVNPHNTHAWNNLGAILNRLAAPLSEIKEAYANALRLDPYNTAAMMNLVGPLVERGEYADAVDLTIRSLKLRPNKPLVRKKGEALIGELFEKSRLALAEKLLRSWTEIRPTDADAWHNLGLIHQEKGDLDGAIACFNKVHEIAPEDNFALLQLAKLSFLLKKGRDCISHCNELLKRGHEPLVAVSLKARVMNLMGGYEPALSFLQPYLDHNPECDVLWVVLAEIHEYRDEYGRAIAALQRAKHVLERAGGDGSEPREFIDQKLEALLARR